MYSAMMRIVAPSFVIWRSFAVTAVMLSIPARNAKLRNPSRQAIEGAWASRAAVDDLTSMTGDQIEVTREGNDLIFTGAYSVKVKLFKNVAACFDFTPSSK